MSPAVLTKSLRNQRSRAIVGYGLVSAILSVSAPGAHAAIDVTGRWIEVLEDFTPAKCMDFMQNGTTLTATDPCNGQLSLGRSDVFTGSIDPNTGAFHLSNGNSVCDRDQPPPCTLSGVVSADGLTFTGTFGCQEAQLSCGVLESRVRAWLSPPTCGDGHTDPGEECDDGHNLPDSCCSPGCRSASPGTVCGPADGCTVSRTCDGKGACVPEPVACEPCSECTLPAGCQVGPTPDCSAPLGAGGSRLVLKGSARPQAKWIWRKGHQSAPVFGDPVHADSYSLCAFDNLNRSPRVLLQASIPSGARWRALGKRGFRYADKLGTVGGVTDIRLSRAKSGKPTIVITAKGAHLGSPDVRPPFPLAVQLKGAGGCWGDSYALDDVEKQTEAVIVVGNAGSASRAATVGRSNFSR